ncbi:DNA double-strand break repair nuclease NurA [Pseudonocardia sp.]|jgi:hypothetical protein|uniref:DNA double-strand break repair nuclease NurA n=1 Tax=Pseudonocardia sp. TaxID=60912 RepID=UPI003D1080D0
MRFTVDPWDPSYGTGLDADAGDEAATSDASIDVTVETAADRWEPVVPDPRVRPPAATLFVDGVRRVDAQAWVDDGSADVGPGSSTAALCASYAAGVVCCAGDRAEPVAVTVARSLLTSAEGATDVVTPAGRYVAEVVPAGGGLAPAQNLSLALQGRLAAIEVDAAGRARAEAGTGDDDLLVVDGPLRGRQHLPRALGYVKTHRTRYLQRLQPELDALIATLAPGERTPVFLLGTSWQRYTWYLRLPTGPGSPWAGVVRLECSAAQPAAEAVAMAALSQVTLPRYASDGYKDSRAPQNLYPIGGLERLLRRRLGDAGVIYRALRRAAWDTADTPVPMPVT